VWWSCEVLFSVVECVVKCCGILWCCGVLGMLYSGAQWCCGVLCIIMEYCEVLWSVV